MLAKQPQACFEWDNFHRLIGHALASYHGLVSSSHDQHGQRCIAFSRRSGTVAASVGCAEVLAALQGAGGGQGVVGGVVRDRSMGRAVGGGW